MNIVEATYTNGQVVLPGPVDWPDGTKVWIEPCNGRQPAALGIPDDQWPTTPEGIAEHLKKMDLIEPFEMSAEERADIAAWRQRVKEYTIANMNQGIDELFP
jgi:hypothetical protein